MSENNGNKNIFEEMFEEKKSAPEVNLAEKFAAEREANEHTLVGEYEGDAQARLFKKVVWGSGLAGVIIGGILIYFFGQYM